MSRNRYLGRIPVGILFVGVRKRLCDTGVQVSRGEKRVLGGLGIVAVVIAAVVAFVLFLGGIPGMGDEGLLLMAAMVIAAPFVLPVAWTVLFGLFAQGSPEENEHGSTPDTQLDGSVLLPFVKRGCSKKSRQVRTRRSGAARQAAAGEPARRTLYCGNPWRGRAPNRPAFLCL